MTKMKIDLSTAAPSAADMFPKISALVDLDGYLKSKIPLMEFIHQIELACLVKTLDRTNGHISNTAKALGIKRTTLTMRIRALKAKGLNPQAFQFKSDK